jgi:hypothetical protein
MIRQIKWDAPWVVIVGCLVRYGPIESLPGGLFLMVGRGLDG